MLWTAGCTLVFDPAQLGDGGAAHNGAGGSGGQGAQDAQGGGGGSGGACACAGDDLVWLFLKPQAALGTAPPDCVDSVAALGGILDGSVDDRGTRCAGSCTPSCSVRLQLTDDCTVSGSTVEGSCVTLTLADEGPSFKIALPPPSCTPASLRLEDAATATSAQVCSPSADACAAAAGAHVCRPARGDCLDPCFPVRRSIVTLDDARSCAALPVTCTGVCSGELERHDDAACSGAPAAIYAIANQSECDSTPLPPLGVESHWRFDAVSPACEASSAPQGFLAAGELLEELCCVD